MISPLLLAVLAAAPTLTLPRFGEVELLRPAGAPKRVAIFVSEHPKQPEPARTLASRGALVLSVDARAYLASFKGKACLYPAGDLEALSQHAQKELGLPEYLHPVLFGDGLGATLVATAIAQAPAGTFQGGAAEGFCPSFQAQAPLCKGNRLEATRKGRFDVLGPQEPLRAPLVLLPGAKPRCPPSDAKAFAPNVELRARGPLADAGEALFPKAAASPKESEAPAEVADLPLVEVKATAAERDAFVLLVSGDGGWAGIDQELAKAFAADGLPVVGLNSLRYFWQRKTAEQTSTDLGRTIRHYAGAWKKQRVILVGFSRGADILPAATARLPAELRAKVGELVLIAPGKNAEFEVKVSDFFGGDVGAPVLPELQKLDGTKVLCLYGDEEKDDTLCTQLGSLPRAKATELKGGHHFGGDYAGVAREALAFLAQGS